MMNNVENGNAKVIEITPELAHQFLAQNDHNRHLRNRAVRGLVAAKPGKF